MNKTIEQLTKEHNFSKDIIKGHILMALEIASEVVSESKHIIIEESRKGTETKVIRMCTLSLVPSVINVMLNHHKE